MIKLVCLLLSLFAQAAASQVSQSEPAVSSSTASNSALNQLALPLSTLSTTLSFSSSSFSSLAHPSSRSSSSSSSSSSFSVLASNCVNSCSSVGLCLSLSSGSFVCQCPRGYLGVDCSVTTSSTTGIQVISNDFKLGTHGTATHEFALITNSSSQLTSSFTVVPSSTLVHIRWTIPTTNAFGTILDVGWDGMNSGDCWTYTTSGSTASLFDYFSSSRSSPTIDSQQDLTSVLGFTTNGYTIMEFTRRLVTTDTSGADLALPLQSGQYVRFMWAVLGGTGAKNQLPMHDFIGSVGQYKVDFVGGNFVELSDGVEWPTGYYYALVILIVVLVAAALERYVVRPFPSVLRVMLHESPLARVGVTASTLQEKMGSMEERDKSKSKCSCLNWCTCDFLPALLSLSVLEWKIVALYFAMVGLVIVQSQSQYTDVGRSWMYVFGHVTALHYALSLLPVTKNSVFLPLFGISRNSTAISWHRRIGRVTLLFTVIHAISQIAIWNAVILFYVPDCQYGMGVIFGTASLVCLVVVTLTSRQRCRRQHWARFYLCHIGCLSMGYVFAMLHSIQLRWFSVIAGVLWCIDISVRWIIRPCCLLRKVRVTDVRVFYGDHINAPPPKIQDPGVQGTAAVTVNPIKTSNGAIVRLQLRVHSSFKYEAGDYVYLYIPELSKFIWHPFTISSFAQRWQQYRRGSDNSNNSDDNNNHDTDSETALTLHIRTNDSKTGDGWTARLLDRCVELQQQQQQQQAQQQPQQHDGMLGYPLSVSIDGPYKSYDIPLLNFDYVILIAGGIGVTPAASYLADYVYRRYRRDPSLPLPRHLHFVWASRSQAAFTHGESGVEADLMKELYSLHKAGDDSGEGVSSANAADAAVRHVRVAALDSKSSVAPSSRSASSSSSSPSSSSFHQRSTFAMSLHLTGGHSHELSDEQQTLQEKRVNEVELDMFVPSPHGGMGASSSDTVISNDKELVNLFIKGRPNFSSVGETTRKQLLLHGIRPFNVGVFVCGPLQLVIDAKSMCQQHGFYFMEDGFIM